MDAGTRMATDQENRSHVSLSHQGAILVIGSLTRARTLLASVHDNAVHVFASFGSTDAGA